MLPTWDAPCGACLGPTIELSAIEVVQIGAPEHCVDPRPALDIAARCHRLAALMAVEDGANPTDVREEVAELGLWEQMCPQERRFVQAAEAGTAITGDSQRHEARATLCGRCGWETI